MKLYASPGACSLAPHIALCELNLPHELVIVNLRHGDNRKPEYLAKNPLGSVPTLEVGEGQFLTEVPAILLYLADSKPEGELAPSPGDPVRYKLYQWLNLIATELHKGLGPALFPGRFVSDEAAQAELAGKAREKAAQRLEHINKHLGDFLFLLPKFSVADIYLFVMLTWWERLEQKLDSWPALQRLEEHMRQRLGVKEAMLREQAALR